MMNGKNKGMDPAIMQAIHTLKGAELSPLEEQLFTGWLAANGMDPTDANTPDNPVDYRSVYQKTGGQVFPQGQLQKMAERQSAIETLMKAQAEHESLSPLQQFLQQSGGSDSNEDPGMNSSIPSMMQGMDDARTFN